MICCTISGVWNLFVPLDVEEADGVHLVRRLHDGHWPNHFVGICSIQELGALASYSSYTFTLCNCSHSGLSLYSGNIEFWLSPSYLLPQIHLQYDWR